MIAQRAALSLTAALLFSAPVAAAPGDVVASEESFEADFNVVEVATGLDHPWSIAFLPDGSMLVTERPGRLRHVALDGTVSAPIAHDLAVTAVNQGGLLEVALHPDFENNRLIYLSYAAGPRNAPHTALDRARLSDDLTRLEDDRTIFVANHRSARGRHFGGRLAFDTEGYLFLTLGDGGDYSVDAQNVTNHIGTIVRLTDDGAPAPGNPFNTIYDGPADQEPETEIWSYGHRNVQGAAINPETGILWAHEHGARGGDEINIPQAGRNYGWPAITYGINYNGQPISEHARAEGMEQPIWYWEPSIAPSGMTFYQGEAFPDWNGDLFIGALAGLQLQRFEVDGDRVIGMEPLLTDLAERIRDVRAGPDGYIYLATDSPEGRILRLEPR